MFVSVRAAYKGYTGLMLSTTASEVIISKRTVTHLLIHCAAAKRPSVV